jgi:hypothetical protein
MSRNKPPVLPHVALRQALDEARFGQRHTLNLRASLPTPWEATVRAEAWLRQQQASGAVEVLVITGRGKGSAGGVSPVRTAVVTLLASLQRKGVVKGVREHTPGSFIVQLVPFRAAHAGGERAARGAVRESAAPRALPPDPQALEGLVPETRALLRSLAVRALADLGLRDPGPAFVEGEMLRQFARIIPTVVEGPGREARLLEAIAAEIERYDD